MALCSANRRKRNNFFISSGVHGLDLVPPVRSLPDFGRRYAVGFAEAVRDFFPRGFAPNPRTSLAVAGRSAARARARASSRCPSLRRCDEQERALPPALHRSQRGIDHPSNRYSVSLAWGTSPDFWAASRQVARAASPGHGTVDRTNTTRVSFACCRQLRPSVDSLRCGAGFCVRCLPAGERASSI
jgi:hypothetical protein